MALSTSVYPSTSTVTGNGTLAVEAFKTYSVDVTAKDSFSVNLNTGGDRFYILISNE
jgi:hypothetical protein